MLDLAEIKMFWKYCAYDAIKKTWIMSHKAVISFGLTFLGSFDVL